MSSFGRQFSPSPVLIMPPQPPLQSSLGMASYTHHAPPRSFGTIANQFAPIPSSRSSGAGKKRSRDEASDNLEPDAVVVPQEEPEEEWVYGPGMILIKPSSRYVTDASSQSGTWLEEKNASEEAARKSQQEEQLAANRRHKSIRTGLGSDLMAAAVPAINASIKTSVKANSPDEPQAPVIDNFTIHLGIGWRRISEDVDIQAAARGWARYIENHFPISNARVLLESKGLQSYLVESNEGFFLFAENLRQGQLVSTTAEGALRNLQCSPPTFDGAETLMAAESPKPTEMHHEGILADTEMRMD